MGMRFSDDPASTGPAVGTQAEPEPGPASAEDGIDALYREHGLRLIRLALLLTGDQPTAEDVVQDAFLGLHRNWDRVRDPARLPAYLRTAVVNGARAVHRGRGRVKARLHLVPRESPVWSAEATAIDGEDRRELLAAVARLPEHQREVLALKFFLDLPEAEIAQTLRISRGTVSSRTARALATLSRQLQEHQ
jgi:RNA polymerase sigma-70 factor (sigma-E family)